MREVIPDGHWWLSNNHWFHRGNTIAVSVTKTTLEDRPQLCLNISKECGVLITEYYAFESVETRDEVASDLTINFTDDVKRNEILNRLRTLEVL